MVIIIIIIIIIKVMIMVMLIVETSMGKIEFFPQVSCNDILCNVYCAFHSFVVN